MATKAEAKRCWEGARVRGEMAAYLLPVMERYDDARKRLNKFLMRKVLTPKEWSQLQHLQGQLKALADLVLYLEGLSKPTPEFNASKRRKVEE